MNITSEGKIEELIADIRLKNMFQILLLTDEWLTIKILNSMRKNDVLNENYVFITIGNFETFKTDFSNFSNINIFIISQEKVNSNYSLSTPSLKVIEKDAYTTMNGLAEFSEINSKFETLSGNRSNRVDYLKFLKLYYQQDLFYNVWNSVYPSPEIQQILSINGLLKPVYKGLYTKYTFATLESQKDIRFNDRTLRVCTFGNNSFSKRPKNGSLKFEHLSGCIIKTLRHLSKTLKFNISIYFQPKAGDLIPGEKYFTGCIGDVQRKKADIGAGLVSFNTDRSSVVDFTYPVLSDPLVLLYKKPRKPLKWLYIWNFPHIHVCLIIPVSIVIVALSITLICKYSPLSAWNLGLDFRIVDEILFKENLWGVIGSLLMQGQDFFTYPISARIMVGFWWIFSVIIMSVFSAEITSFLTTDLGVNELKTLEDFYNLKDIIVYLSEGTVGINVISKSDDPIIQKLKSKSQISNELRILTRTSPDTLGYVVDYSLSLTIIKKHCENFAILPEIVESSFSGFIVPKFSEYKYLIDMEIQKLTSLGLIQKWFWEDINLLNSTICSADTVNTEPIGFDVSLGYFILLIAINGMGSLLIFIELIVKRYGKFTNKLKT